MPDEPVQRQLLAVQFGRERIGRPVRRRRADRLVGLLRALRLRLVLLRRSVQVLRSVLAGDGAARRIHRLVGEDDVVGTHVGDEATLVQPLRDAHHLRRRQAQLAAALLLQRRGHERRLRRRLVRLLFDRTDGEGRFAEAVGQPAGTRLVERHDLVLDPAGAVEVLAARDAIARNGDQLRVEGGVRCGEYVDVPVVGGDVRDAFAFAFDDQAHRRRLHAAGGQPAVDTAPQHGRHLVAVQPVEDAAGLGGVDHPVIDPAWVGHRVVDRRLGDLVEHHPLHGDLRLQVLEEVPRDGLALAVLVRCEIELGGVLQRGFEFLDDALAALGQLVGRLETVLRVDVQTLRRQVGHVAHRGAHVVVAPEQFRECLRLRWGFDDDEWLRHLCLS